MNPELDDNISGLALHLLRQTVSGDAAHGRPATAPASGAAPAKEGQSGEGGSSRKKKEKKEKKPADDEKITFNAPYSNFPLWYEQILIAADIVDKRYPLKGMPVFKPYGYFTHDKIMQLTELEWDKLDIEKAQFPMLIPFSFLAKEEDHIKGFESECFWVTKGGLKDLDEKLALRPTSETCMYHMFSMWVRSFRDLPLKVHQTCNIFRHETKDTLPLIRVREIHWNEAHTCHNTEAEALQQLEDAWEGYINVISKQCGVYGLRLVRPDWDRFAGGEKTYVMDTIMPSGKVLQIIGAHYLGQKFAKVFDIKFLNQKNKFEYAYMTCFGISTRVLAACLSIHGDDKGLVIPPPVSKYHVVIIPIIMKKSDHTTREKANEVYKMLRAKGYRVKVDDADKKPGDKYYHWEMKGVPLRMEIGPRDVENKRVTIVRRDNGEKIEVPEDGLADKMQSILDEMLEAIRKKGQASHENQVTDCSTLEEVKAAMAKGGFAKIPFHSMGMDGKEGDRIVHEACGGEVRGYVETDEKPPAGTKCVATGKPATYYGYVAKSY